MSWFVAKDICDILEYKNPREILSRYVKDSDKSSVTICDGTSLIKADVADRDATSNGKKYKSNIIFNYILYM